MLQDEMEITGLAEPPGGGSGTGGLGEVAAVVLAQSAALAGGRASALARAALAVAENHPDPHLRLNLLESVLCYHTSITYMYYVLLLKN